MMYVVGLALHTRPESLSEVVYETIRDAIVNRTIPPGARVTEAGLAKQLNVSKTPVREALLRLREIGLIESFGVRGGRIILPSLTSIRHAYEVRLALETFAAETAAERADPDTRREIDAAARSCLKRAEAGDFEGFRAWDTRFHEAVVRASDNPRLANMIADVFTLVTALRRRDVPHAEGSIECARAHVRIAEAIAAGDADRAHAEMRAHVRQVEAYVVASLSERGGGAFAA
jgi:DNA-binding GntR family transcriptional regulator